MQPRSITSTLLFRAKAMDEKAWQEMVAAFHPIVRVWLRQGGVPRDEIGDLEQNVWLRVTKSLAKFQREGERSTFTGWLRVVTQNVKNDFFRSKAASNLLIEDPFQIPDPVADSEEIELSPTDSSRLLMGILKVIQNDFDKRTFDIFWRCEVEGFTPKELAREYGMKDSAVRQAKYRVKARLLSESSGLFQDGFFD